MASPRPASWIRILAVVAIAWSSAMCGEDDVGNGSDLVGGACQHDPDCSDRCVEGKDFPNGTCTVDCHDDGDCPDGTHCIDSAGGVCLLSCEHDPDCRGGYDCRDRKRRGHGGNAPVCFGG
jgi:hypothetical protein